MGNDFNYKGKYEGKVYSSGNSKSNIPVYPCASHASVNIASPDLPPVTTSCRPSMFSINPKGVHTVQLPKLVIALLNNPLAHSIAFMPNTPWHCTSLLIANTSATDHRIPDKSAFISYGPVSGCRVRMGNNSFAPILGTGLAIISLNGKKILIRDYLLIPALCNPLFSLHAHQCQHRCGFIGMHNLGMYVFFPSFIVEVNTTTNCHILYKPIRGSTTMSTLEYIEPVQPSNSASSTAATPLLPAVIKDYNDNNYLPTYAPHWPKKPPTPPLPAYNMSLIPPLAYSVSLKDLDWDALIQRLYSVELAAPPRPPPPASEVPKKGLPPTKLECMSTDNIVARLHHPESHLPPIWPCDTPNLSDTKTAYTPNKLHCLTGCCCFATTNILF